MTDERPPMTLEALFAPDAGPRRPETYAERREREAEAERREWERDLSRRKEQEARVREELSTARAIERIQRFDNAAKCPDQSVLPLYMRRWPRRSIGEILKGLPEGLAVNEKAAVLIMQARWPYREIAAAIGCTVDAVANGRKKLIRLAKAGVIPPECIPGRIRNGQPFIGDIIIDDERSRAQRAAAAAAMTRAKANGSRVGRPSRGQEPMRAPPKDPKPLSTKPRAVLARILYAENREARRTYMKRWREKRKAEGKPV